MCNLFGTKTPPVISGFTHYCVIGGVSSDGTGILLKSYVISDGDDNANPFDGTEYSLNFSFQNTYIYTVKINASVTINDQTVNYPAPYPNIFIYADTKSGATNSSSCGYADFSGETSSVSSMKTTSTSSTTYTFPPFSAKTGQSYLHVGTFPTNSGPSTSSTTTVKITKITITAVAPCQPLTTAPTGLTTTNGATTLTWNAYAGATSYDVSINDNGTIVSKNTMTNSLGYCSTNGHAISYQVAAKVSCSTSPYSSPYTFTAIYASPPPPTGLTYTPPNTLSWQPVSGIGSYLVTVDQLPNGIGAYWVYGTSVSGSSAELSSGKSYQVTVSSGNGCAIGNPSSPITFSVAPLPPPPCNTPYVSNTETLGGGVVNVAWQAVSGAASYNIQFVGPTTITFSNYVPVGNLNNGINFPGIPPGNYTVSVQANCTSGLTSAWGSFYRPTQVYSSDRGKINSLTETMDTSSASLNTITGTFKLYPNPAKSQVTVYYNAINNGNANIEVFNELGAKLIIKNVVTITGPNSYSVSTGPVVEWNLYDKVN